MRSTGLGVGRRRWERDEDKHEEEDRSGEAMVKGEEKGRDDREDTLEGVKAERAGERSSLEAGEAGEE